MMLVSGFAFGARPHRPAPPTPSLWFDFMSGNLGAGLTLSRTSAAPCHDAAGVMQMAPANQPRFDHDPVTRAPLGLLIEGAATNLLWHSQDFPQTSWVKSNVGVVGGQAAPDGSATAAKVTPDTASSLHRISQGWTPTAGQKYTQSVWLKSAGVRWVCVNMDANAGARLTVDLQTGAFVTGGAAPENASVVAYPNGWYRVAVTGTGTGATGNDTWFQANTAMTVADTVFAGNGADGFIIWGAQLEAGLRATSHIPTTIGPATRAADALAPLSLSGLWAAAGGIGGTILMDVDADGPVNTARGYLWAISDAGLSRLALRAWNQGVSDDSCKIVAGDGTVNTDTLIATALRGRQRIAVSYINGAAPMVSLSGAAAVTSARTYVHDPANATITFGGGFSGHLRSIRIYRRPMTGAQLQALTA